MYEALAARLPRDAVWLTTPLSRTQRTAQAIQEAGYPETAWAIEPGLIEQSMGDYHGLRHHELPEKLSMPAHPFWPMSAEEVPPRRREHGAGRRAGGGDPGAAGRSP